METRNQLEDSSSEDSLSLSDDFPIHVVDPEQAIFSAFHTAVDTKDIAAVRESLSQQVGKKIENNLLFVAAIKYNREVMQLLLQHIGPLQPDQLEVIIKGILVTDEKEDWDSLDTAILDMMDLLEKHGTRLGDCPFPILGCQLSETVRATLVSKYRHHFSQEDIKKSVQSILNYGSLEALKAIYPLLDHPVADEFAADIKFLDKMARHLKVSGDASGCLEFLFARGLDANVVTASGTLLEQAAAHDDLASVQVLLKAGANPDNFKMTEPPLISAINHRNKEMVTLLLQHHANKTVCDKQGKQALQIARERRLTAILSLLQGEDKKELAINSHSQETHYYIHCRLQQFPDFHPGRVFYFMIAQPRLLETLPLGIAPNCEFDKVISKPTQYIDLGLSKEEKDDRDLIEIDFYYECSQLDKDEILRAIEKLKATYFKRDAASPQATLDQLIFDPVSTITNALLDSLNSPLAARPISPHVSNSLFGGAASAALLLDSDEELDEEAAIEQGCKPS